MSDFPKCVACWDTGFYKICSHFNGDDQCISECRAKCDCDEYDLRAEVDELKSKVASLEEKIYHILMDKEVAK